MKSYVFGAICLLACLLAIADAKPNNAKAKSLKARSLEARMLAKVQQHERLRKESRDHQKRDDDDCNGLGDTCTGYAWDACCGDNTCYWSDGRDLLSPGQEGVCVSCISLTNACQFDWQCCTGTVCHRESRFDTNGACGYKKALGESCHEDDNCLSDDCGFWSGVCEDDD